MMNIQCLRTANTQFHTAIKVPRLVLFQALGTEMYRYSTERCALRTTGQPLLLDCAVSACRNTVEYSHDQNQTYVIRHDAEQKKKGMAKRKNEKAHLL